MNALLKVFGALSIEIDTIIFLSSCWLVTEKIFIMMGYSGVPLTPIDIVERAKVTTERVLETKDEIINPTVNLASPSSVRTKVE